MAKCVQHGSSTSSVSQVQGTNDNSTLSKVSTSRAGYYKDPYLVHFTSHHKPPNRAPLIHWGYWIRFSAVNGILKQFITSEGHNDNQVVSLGAGFDTAYFRLKSECGDTVFSKCHYYEIDYPAVVKRKQTIIDSVPELQELVTGGHYGLIGCDITELCALEASLKAANVNPNAPTLLIAEVVLTYIPPKHVDRILNWAAGFFSKAVLCVYEQVNPFDAFGQVMLKHFRTLSSPLLNIELYPTPQSQCKRFENAGWSQVYSCDMNKLYFSMSEEVRRNVISMEPFDEYEEWHLKCSHYHMLIGLTSPHYWSKIISSLPPHAIRVNDESHVEEWTVFCCDTEFDHLKRYGHDSVKLNDGQMLIYGGFGLKSLSQAHCRLDNLVIIESCSKDWKSKELVVENDGPGPLMYHSMTLLPSSNEIILIGGRKSPKISNEKLYLLSLCGTNWNWRVIQHKGDIFEGRWRHSATLLNDRWLVIIGGCTVNGSVLSDILLLDLCDWIIKKLPVSLPNGRHSHLAMKYQSSVLIIGGLNTELSSLSSCLQLSENKGHWSLETLEFTPQLPAKYSMSGHVISSDVLIICGGVSVNQQHDIIIINMQKRIWHGVNLKYPPSLSRPLLHSHTSHLTDKNAIICIGGGGNCFSFGTHLNVTPLVIKVDHLL